VHNNFEKFKMYCPFPVWAAVPEFALTEGLKSVKNYISIAGLGKNI
jgi:hypothetical protein